jgi:hypothetical protein
MYPTPYNAIHHRGTMDLKILMTVLQPYSWPNWVTRRSLRSCCSPFAVRCSAANIRSNLQIDRQLKVLLRTGKIRVSTSDYYENVLALTATSGHTGTGKFEKADIQR